MSEQALVPMEELKTLAASVAASKFFKAFDTPEKALVLMAMAQAEGCHPMQAVLRYDVIEGKPAKKSDAMLADFQARGGIVTWSKMNDKEVEAVFSAPGIGSPLTVSWTIEMANKAGLTGKNNWKNYPRAMLRARVVSEGIRAAMPGVVAGLYTPEEVQDFDAAPVTLAARTRPAVGTPHFAKDSDVAAGASKPSVGAVIEAEVVPSEPKASEDQIKALCASMNEIGLKKRAEGMEWVNKVIAPARVESKLDLTSSQASKCIDAAKQQAMCEPQEPGSEG